ncbi:AI-2E family transporter [Gymnodinialimonas ulvae]|uniref:AI-2E family transporter n=1 Tax=Gymnodinialimonas ulvae TaxID=3126504 RepID=UPI0030A871FF
MTASNSADTEDTVHEDADPEPTGEALSSDRWAAIVPISVLIIAFLAVIYSLAVARVFIVPVILAFLLALVFSPLCRWFRRRGVPEPVSAGAILLGLVAGLFIMTLSLAAPVSQWIEDAPFIAQELQQKLRGLAGIAEAVAEANEQVQEVADPSDDEIDDPMEVVVRSGGPLTSVAYGAPVILGQTAFVLLLLYFILASGPLFYERLVRVMPTLADKKRAVRIAYDVEREVSRYLLTITVINAGLGAAVTVSFSLLDMPSAVVFGLLAFALNYVPFIGAIIGTFLTLAVALVTKDTATAAFLVAFTYWALTSIEAQVVTPLAVGRRLKLNTVVILIAVAFWAWIWSIMGMLMAVPLLVTLRVFCDHVPQLKPVGAFLSGR